MNGLGKTHTNYMWVSVMKYFPWYKYKVINIIMRNTQNVDKLKSSAQIKYTQAEDLKHNNK